MTGPTDLLESGHRIGRLVWTEARLFEVTGRWVATTSQARAKAFIATASRHHGWHAELLSDLLPIVATGPSADAFVGPADGEIDDVETVEQLTDTVARLTQLWTVLLPHHIARAEDYIAATSPVSDAAAHRLLRIVIADEQADIAAAQQALRSLPLS